ncbi:MAG: putative kinase [Gammaproteobacteria bacterium]
MIEQADVASLQTLRRWNGAIYHGNKELVFARRRDGYVRECHGDLHLGNVALVDGHPLIFDCIEFSDDLRWIDVMSEVAFLTMDFDYHGRADLAWRFIDRYLQHTGDYKGLALLRYYQAYRAAVRAKIAALRGAQSGLERAEATRKKTEARDRLQQACAYTDVRPLSVTITRGLSGCGKTTITDTLLQRTGSIRLRSDVERKRMHGLSTQAQSASALDGGLYSRDATGATYEQLQKLTEVVLRAGFSVIVDATFLDRVRRDAFRSLARSHDATFKILDIGADEQLLRERVAQRARSRTDASEATVSVLERQLKSADVLAAEELADVVHVDGGVSIDWRDLTRRLYA